MSKTHTDSVWKLVATTNGKQYAACKHCSHKLQVNAKRFKHHLVLYCDMAPENVKAKYKAIACSQSITTSLQKRKLFTDSDSKVSGGVCDSDVTDIQPLKTSKYSVVMTEASGSGGNRRVSLVDNNDNESEKSFPDLRVYENSNSNCDNVIASFSKSYETQTQTSIKLPI